MHVPALLGSIRRVLRRGGGSGSKSRDIPGSYIAPPHTQRLKEAYELGLYREALNRGCAAIGRIASQALHRP